MNSLGIKTLLLLSSFVLTAQLVQGAAQCLRTNKKPRSSCTRECLPDIGCSRSRKRCLCDGDCGYSCIDPNQRCMRPRLGNGRVIFDSLGFNSTYKTICNRGFKLFGSETRTCRGNGFWDGKRSKCRKSKTLCADPGSPGLLMRYQYTRRKAFKPGTKLLYYCPFKFILVGSRILECKRNGEWSASLPVCQEPKCNTAVLPSHSYVIRPKNWRRLRDYGIRLTLGCIPGYTMGGQRGELICITPGWNLEPVSFKCFPKSCPDPGMPRYGQRKGQFVFGKKVYFTCDKCYKLKGPNYRQCQANQRWSDYQPTCERVVCADLDNPANGRVIVMSNQCGSSLQYNCNYGYQLGGARERTCLSDGTWSGNEPRCLKPKHKCIKAVLPPNSYVTRPNNWESLREADDRINLGCNRGYTVKRGELVCSTDGWELEPSSFKCSPKRCRDPGRPRNGQRKGQFVFGERVSFTCDKCYKLKGPSYRQCQADQRWSDYQPTCERVVCASVPRISNGRVVRRSNRCDSSVQYNCHYGYQLDGARERTCQSDGTWSKEEPTCLAKRCPDPGPPRNGQRKGQFVVGERVSFTCDKCYKLKGPSYRQCQASQRWSNYQPTCERVVCAALQSPDNGYAKVPSSQCGRSASYRCNYNYDLDGARERMCQSDGTWSGKEPTCSGKKTTRLLSQRPTQSAFIRRTKSPTKKSTSSTTTATSTNVPTTVKLTSTTVTLQSPCGQPNLPSEAKIRNTWGNNLLIGCKNQYTLVSRGFMVCIKKSWRTYTRVRCLRRGCSFPGVPENGRKHGLSYMYNDVITFSCITCYTLSGHSERTCLRNGTWSHSQPKCVFQTCPPLRSTAKAVVDQASWNCGATATYRCRNSNEVMLGSGERTCGENGAWTGHEPKCIDRNFNIALGKSAIQSSYDEYWYGPGRRAVNGNRNSVYGRRGHCTHTKRDYDSWWRVDLKKEEPVAMVIVVNRKDCCYTRLNYFEVSVGNSRDGRKNAVCGGVPRPRAGEVMEIKCPSGLKGRYVTVYLPKNRWSILTLCEVEVYRRLIF